MNVPIQKRGRPTEELNALFYNAFQSISNGILIVSDDMDIVFANDFMFENFGFSPDAPDNTFCSLFPGLQPPNAGFQCKQMQDCENCILRNSLNKILCDRAAVEGVTFSHTNFIDQEENSKWFLLSGSPLFYNNEVYGILTFVDITLCKHKEQQLLKKLELDLSTNTLNKHSLFKNINKLLSAGNMEHFTLCMMDFDCFKKINDNYGHIMGDKVLNTFSYISRKNIRANDIIGRYGGEEFIFMFPDTGLEDAARVIIRIQKEVKDHFSGLLSYPVSFSAGMLHMEAYQSLTCMELINQVDKLMYQAKENGKNRIMTINKEYRFF
ncbi:MAG: sensor domain-containing diguanylate cyclase [Clostridiaceae bacterium]|jgi:diguanylate cyclase (GGDEF)-like protein|nr:sensor domain-containing diguanylate cyclase [Clostridiaceae bacterium]